MDRWNCGWWCAATVAVACCALAQRGLVGERNVVTQVGGYAVFDCALDFPHDIEIPYVLQWYKDDVKIFSWYDGVSYAADTYAGRVARVAGGMANARGWGRGSINLTAVRETDAGRYTCRVLFPNRTPNTRNNGTCFQLEVDGGNLIARPPVNASTLEGGRAVLECVRKSTDTFVRWLKDGTPIADLAELAQRAALGEDGALTVDPAAMSDLGEYECEVSDAMGNLQSARAYLNVQFKAKVIYAPAEVVLPYGRAARLDCHYRANPPLTNLRWEKDGFLFDPLNVRGVYYRRNGSLHFNQTDESHAGMYSCTPYNELGTEGASPVIRVLVRRPPAFLQRPQELYLARLGDTLALPCQATDGAVVTWSRKDGAALAEGRAAVEGGNLTLEGVREEDRGAYVCEARNEAAAVRAVAEVAVENAPPRAPHDLTYRADHTSITLRWQPGYSRPYMDYHVWWRPVDVSEWRTMKILSLRTTEATINHLQPGHEYEIMVLCQDKRGDGMFSKAIRAFTKQYGGESGESSAGGSESFLQLGPPGNVTAHLVAEGFLVTWSPPEYGLEVLRLYVVRWYQGPHEYLLGSAETKNNYMLIPNLSEDEVYTFQVFSMSTADYQTGSEKVSVAVPAYARIRAVGAACGVLAVLLAACALVLYAARRRLCGLARRDDARSRKCNNAR